MCVCVCADVPFSLSELRLGVESRLFFTSGQPEHTQYSGVFNLPGPNVVAEETLTVYAMVGELVCML